MTCDQTSIDFENAMFGGVETLIKFYSSYVRMLAKRNEDRSRATLGAGDIKSHCEITIWKCWKKQASCLNIKNFDMMVKKAMANTIRTLIGREYCIKRGRNSRIFLSELVVEAQFGDENHEVDVDALLYQLTDHHRGDKKENVANQINSYLEPHLQDTFNAILDCSRNCFRLNPFALNKRVKNELEHSLGMNEKQMEDDVFGILFILNGFKQAFNH